MTFRFLLFKSGKFQNPEKIVVLKFVLIFFFPLVALIFTLLLAPFAFKLVNYWRHSESLNIRKNSEIDDIFLRRQLNKLIVDFKTYFKDSLYLQLTNFGVKGAKRSVKMWTTNFYRSFSKKFLLYMSSRLSKICSVHMYVMPRTVYFG